MSAAAESVAKPKTAEPETKKKSLAERPAPPPAAVPRYLQARLEAGASNDPLEAEAERIAERVSGGAHPAPAPGRAAPTRPQRRGEKETKPNTPAPKALPLPRGGGRPLEPRLRGEMEGAMGADFSAVRIHEGPEAATSAAALHAAAYTLGPDIAFATGRYAPETPEGRHLLAHELTHTVQQGAAPVTSAATPVTGRSGGRVQRWGWDDLTDAVSSGAEWVGGKVAEGAEWVADKAAEVASLVGDALAEFGWALVSEIAPSLEPILRQGPIEWIKEQMGALFDSVTGALDDFSYGTPLEGLGSGFGDLIKRGAKILAALTSGDCKPLFTAIGEIQTFVVEVAGDAWNGLKELFAPVGDFFSGLWSDFGAPAVDWLKQAAGGLWESIKDLGSKIWELVEPVKEAGTNVWGWFKETLFGSSDDGDSGGSEDGLLGWIKGKAGEAWDWVKAQTEPVWKPVASLAETVAGYLPPPFIQSLGEQMEAAGKGLTDTATQMEGEGAVENRETLAEVLPSVDEVITAAHDGLAAARDWLLGGLRALPVTIGGFLDTLAATPLIGKISGALGWLREMAADVLKWAEEKAAVLLNGVIAGFDWLAAKIIKPMIGVLQSVGEVIGDVLQLPGLVLGAAWKLIPECLRNPIRDFLINHIIAHIPLIGQFAQMGDIWGMIQETVIGFLKRVFVHGDLGGAVLFVLKAVMNAVGLPVEWMLKIFGSALSTIGDILLHPIDFIFNLVQAVVGGVEQFGTNILEHLKKGLFDWLFGTLGGAGIVMPPQFDLAGLLDITLQILGISMEKIEEKARDLFGDQAVDLFLTAMDWIKALVSGGLGGLWEEIKGQLSNLWGAVIGGISEWITGRLVAAGIRFIANLSTGYGAIIEAIIGIYNTVMAVIERFKQILGLVEAVTGALSRIAKGVLQPASDAVERAFGSAVPVVLALLARLAGIGDPASAIKGVVEDIRATVDAALDWLVKKARGIAETLLGGKKKDEKSEPKKGSDIGKPITIQTPDETHTLYITRNGRKAEVMMASTPDEMDDHLTRYQKTAEKIPNEENRKKALALIPKANAATNEVDRVADQIASLSADQGNHADKITELQVDVVKKEEELKAIMVELLPLLRAQTELMVQEYIGKPLTTFSKALATEDIGLYYSVASNKRIRRKPGTTEVAPKLTVDKDENVIVKIDGKVTHWTEQVLANTPGKSTTAWLGAYTGRGTNPDSMAYGLDANGHLMGAQFGGSNGLENLSAMQGKVNSPVFSKFENKLKDEMVENQVRVQMEVEGDDSYAGREAEWSSYTAKKSTKDDVKKLRGNLARLNPPDLPAYLAARPTGYTIRILGYQPVIKSNSGTTFGPEQPANHVLTMGNPITAAAGAAQSVSDYSAILEKLKELSPPKKNDE